MTAQSAGIAPGRMAEHRLRALLRSRSGFTGLVIVALLVVFAGLSIAGLLPYDPARQDAPAQFQGPSAAHWFGTDQFGRDVFSRVSAGLANTFAIAVVSVLMATVAGTFGGLVAGFFGRGVDAVVGGVTNILFAFPSLLLALTLAAVLDRNWFTVALAIAIVYIPIFVRVVRGPVLSLREAEYVAAARASGMRGMAILLRHVLPNLAGILIVQVTLSLSWAVLTEASLSFLGFGAPPPTPSLGAMIYEARTLVTLAPWTMAAPGVVIVLFVIGLNLLGDGLRDVLDPRNRGKR